MSFKRGQKVYIPNGQSVAEVSVTRVYKGMPYAVVPGMGKKSKALDTDRVFTEEIPALKFMVKDLGVSIKSTKEAVSAYKKGLKSYENTLKSQLASRDKMKAKIAKLSK